MKVYVAIQTAGLEVTGLWLFTTRERAKEHFDAISEEDRLLDWPAFDLQNEPSGEAIMGAGDDCAAIVIYERELAP